MLKKKLEEKARVVEGEKHVELDTITTTSRKKMVRNTRLSESFSRLTYCVKVIGVLLEYDL